MPENSVFLAKNTSARGKKISLYRRIVEIFMLERERRGKEEYAVQSSL